MPGQNTLVTAFQAALLAAMRPVAPTAPASQQAATSETPRSGEFQQKPMSTETSSSLAPGVDSEMDVIVWTPVWIQSKELRQKLRLSNLNLSSSVKSQLRCSRLKRQLRRNKYHVRRNRIRRKLGRSRARGNECRLAKKTRLPQWLHQV